MIMLTDEKKTFGISMKIWDGDHYSPDMAAEFFEVGSLPCDEYGAYIVPDVEYCIDYARDWQDGHGDFAGDTDTENRLVIADEMTITGTRYKHVVGNYPEAMSELVEHVWNKLQEETEK